MLYSRAAVSYTIYTKHPSGQSAAKQTAMGLSSEVLHFSSIGDDPITVRRCQPAAQQTESFLVGQSFVHNYHEASL